MLERGVRKSQRENVSARSINDRRRRRFDAAADTCDRQSHSACARDQLTCTSVRREGRRHGIAASSPIKLIRPTCARSAWRCNSF